MTLSRHRILDIPLTVQAISIAPDVSISLSLASGEVDLDARCHELSELESVPFWAFCWASGQALARFVFANPGWVRGKDVVDFGAGSGVAGIGARLAGARSVVAVDIDARAREACRTNAELNRVEIEVASELPNACDVILAADVLYDDSSGTIERLLRSHSSTVLLADPGRPSSPRLSESALATYSLETVPNIDPPMRRALVYALAPPDTWAASGRESGDSTAQYSSP